MTDREALFTCRFSQAEETLADARQVRDYKEFAEISAEEAAELVMHTEEFMKELKGVIVK